MMWDFGFGAWWMWIPGVILPLLIVAGIVVVIVLLARSGGAAGRGPAQSADVGDPARRILEERLVRGEITPDQFRELRGALDESRRQQPGR
jgi:putative membrane protein